MTKICVARCLPYIFSLELNELIKNKINRKKVTLIKEAGLDDYLMSVWHWIILGYNYLYPSSLESPMLKDAIKRIEQDITWKKICKELNWQFIPTI